MSAYSDPSCETRLRLAELPGIQEDIKGIRGDVSRLTSVVMRSLEADARQERDIACLEERVATIASESGKKAGRSAAAPVSVILTSLVSGQASHCVRQSLR